MRGNVLWSRCSATLALLIAAWPSSQRCCWAKTKCVSVSGRLVCDRDGRLHAGVKVQLFDRDSLAWERDDLMGAAWSSPNGTFSLRGCGYDFGPWNTPDPYLRIAHRCRSASGDTATMGVLPIFEPATSNVGRIRLDDEYD